MLDSYSIDKRAGPWLRTQQLNSTTSSTVRKGNERQYPIVFETPTYASASATSSTRRRALIVFSKDTGGQDSTGE